MLKEPIPTFITIM